ncbi:amino acid-binding protein [Halarchaeum grantii]|uniref:Amino acid-binding protein n=1 Tax=Halarchaeum grantii TaxID=1193105 RepID=A0A830F354_9EURY|nr:amino acid-binding protein [Halarchaeum grantii]
MPLATDGEAKKPAVVRAGGTGRGAERATPQRFTAHDVPPGVFEDIMRKFEGSPGQQAVIRLLLERGFSVNDEGRVVSGSIEIANTQLAQEVGVDRRVVDSTTDAILADEELRRIFQNISQIPSLMDLAPVLDLTVVTVAVHDADDPGLVAQVTGLLAEHEISIRQTISEDPEFTDEPRLYLVVADDLPGDVVTELMALPFVRSVELS